MTITRKELVKIRINLAKQMNEYIKNMGDEEVWQAWIMLGIPDCPCEEDYLFIAEDDNEWQDLCRLFGDLT